MDDDSPKLQLFCAGCGERFFVCLPCYRGQAYCHKKGCRRESRTVICRQARARHQGSEEGRLDHRDHQRAYRARQAHRVMDLGIGKFDSRLDCVPREEPTAPITGADTALPERQTYGQVHTETPALGEGDVVAADVRPDQATASNTSNTTDGVQPEPAAASSGSTPREPVTLPGHPLARCIVCGRAGNFILPGPHRRARARERLRPLFGRARASLSVAPGFEDSS